MNSGSGSFPPEFLDDIRARMPVSAVVGRRVKLERRGREFVGLSPFSHEKTPSFTVNDEKGFYHCFSTQEHGDVFAFVMKTQGVTFPEAVELLAQEAGFDVPQRDPRAAQKAAHTAALQALVEDACKIYEAALWAPEGAHALTYLRGRGLSDETIRRFRLGYAPPGNYLKERLIARGEGGLLETKMLSPAKEGRASFDFFRDRVLFPIHDLRGRAVAFGGRVMGDGEPKYLNSADTPLFHKGKLLYGLSLAREAAAEAKAIVVVEGYVDVIAMAQAGIAHTVAPLGTALTETQLALLWRYAAEPVLCFDGDKAGKAAALRAANRALPLLQPGFSLRFARLPAGKDPDDLCRTEGGVHALREIIAENATCTLSQVIWDQLVAEHSINTPERRAGFEAAAFAKAAEIQNEIVRSQYEQFFRAEMAKLFPAESAPPDDAAREPVDRPAPKPPRSPHHDPDADGPDPVDILGEHCPISALGHSMRGDGRGAAVNTYHFLDVKGQVQSLSAGGLRTPTNVLNLFFGEETWLEGMAANKTAEGGALPGDKATWKATKIVPLLMRACAAAGFFEPDHSVRGPGVWPFGVVKEWPRRDSRVVVHTGAWVYVFDAEDDDVARYRGGVRVGDFVYARTRGEDDLADDVLSDEQAYDMVRFYRAWQWAETATVLDGLPLVGFLLFGWLASAGITALLPRRPTIFLRGPTNSGKSAVCSHHETLLGSSAIRLENATMTGIRQEFRDPQPVRALICNEANERDAVQAQEQLRQVLDLALYCYSSGEGRQLRGPGGISGLINATFMFAAVRPPTLRNDDANRMLLLNMRELPWMDHQGITDFNLWREQLEPLGPMLRRRMIERWPEYPAVLAAFSDALFKLGYGTREVDTFATLMACAWLGSQSGSPSVEQCHDIASAVSGSMFVQAMNEADPEWQRCWTHLTTSRIEWYGGKKSTIGELIRMTIDDKSSVSEAGTALKGFGLAFVRRVSKADAAKAEAENQIKPQPRQWIAVAYGHQGLEEIFKGSPWRDRKWAVLSQMPGAEGNHPANFHGAPRSKAWLIPVETMRAREGDEAYADDPIEAATVAEVAKSM